MSQRGEGRGGRDTHRELQGRKGGGGGRRERRGRLVMNKLVCGAEG